MLSLTALLHTKNDALRLGRCLETAYPCDGILIVDHGSTDHTLQVARAYGAQIVRASSQKEANMLQAERLISTEWVICLDPRESLSEALAASLFEWKWNEAAVANENGYALLLRVENQHGWIEDPMPQTRMVPMNSYRWNGAFPVCRQSPRTLEGKLLRFSFP
jgi:glycosyltransferase involved in cell wall biosynthesis